MIKNYGFNLLVIFFSLILFFKQKQWFSLRGDFDPAFQGHLDMSGDILVVPLGKEGVSTGVYWVEAREVAKSLMKRLIAHQSDIKITLN